MPVFTSLLKASVVAALVFALSWIRPSDFIASAEAAARIFIAWGLLILIVSLAIGYPAACAVRKLELVRWKPCAIVGAAIGGLLSAPLAFQVPSDSQEIGNPFAISLSPWHRNNPGFVGDTSMSTNDAIGSIVFVMVVGAALGLSFWYFYSGASRPNQSLNTDAPKDGAPVS